MLVCSCRLPLLPPHLLLQEQCGNLLADLSALAAPGSRLLFDTLHADALEGLAGRCCDASCSSGPAAAAAEAPPGLANLAAAAANKGAPLCSGQPAAFSGMVRWLQPHAFRLTELLPPREVARLSLRLEQQRHNAQPAAAPAAVPGKGKAAALPPPERLPYVPEFFSLACAVKQDPRMRLRHADLAVADVASAGAADAGASLQAGWGALHATALSSPSCFLRSLAFLFGGSTPAPAAQAASALGAPPTAPPGAAPPASHAVAPGSSSGSELPSPPRQERSADWTLPAVAPGSAALAARRSMAGSPASRQAAAPAPAAAGALAHALSIAALLPVGSGSRGGSSDSSGSGAGFEQRLHDAAHLLAGASTAGAAEGGAAAAAGEQADAAWCQFF